MFTKFLIGRSNWTYLAVEREMSVLPNLWSFNPDGYMSQLWIGRSDYHKMPFCSNLIFRWKVYLVPLFVIRHHPWVPLSCQLKENGYVCKLNQLEQDQTILLQIALFSLRFLFLTSTLRTRRWSQFWPETQFSSTGCHNIAWSSTCSRILLSSSFIFFSLHSLHCLQDRD